MSNRVVSRAMPESRRICLFGAFIVRLLIICTG
jgi:hypothetical protein